MRTRISMKALAICLLNLFLSAAKANPAPLEYAHMEVTITAKRVFRFAFNPTHFRWEEGNFGGGQERPDYRYTPFLKDEADMPEWMKYKYSQRHKAGFIYGVPPRAPEFLELDVVALNLLTFERGLLRLSINITNANPDANDSSDDDADDHVAQRCVKLKIDNLNLEDIFDAHRLRNLKELFKEHLWRAADPDLHLTFIASSIDVGYRRPLEPSLKDGVVVHLGSTANFSSDLLELDRETSPLRAMPSCPRDFKRTSVERHFRAKGFALDWCEFRLLELYNETGEYLELGSERPKKVVEEKWKVFFHETTEVEFPDRKDLPVVDWTEQYVIIAIPTVIVALVLIVLLCCLFCVRWPGTPMVEREEQREALVASFLLVVRDCFSCCEIKEKQRLSAHVIANEDFQTTHIRSNDARSRRASSVQRQTDTLRRLAQQRNVSPRLLQHPAPGTSVYVPETTLTENPGYFDDRNATDDGGPIILLSDEATSPLGSTPEGSVGNYGGAYGNDGAYGNAYYGGNSGHASLSRRRYEMSDPLGSLPRPRPPAYYERNESRGGYNDEDEGTYLV